MTAYQQHLRMTELVKSERKITDEILKLIQNLDSTKAFAELGYSSLFDYLTRGHKYSEGAAQRRISAARLIKELPEIQSEITSGKINLTQLSKLAIAVKQEQKSSGHRVLASKKKEIVLRLQNKNNFETEKILSQELNYSPSPSEKVIPKNEDIILTLKLSKPQYEKLQKAQNYLSHSQHDSGFAEIIEVLCEKLIRQKEEVKTQKQDSKQESNLTATVAVENSEKTKQKIHRTFIPKATHRYIFNKAKNCCEYISPLTGGKCQSRYQLQLDHKTPLAKGGGNNPENLRVLCRAHNLAEARRWGLTRCRKPLSVF